MGITYKDAGVNIDKANVAVERIKRLVKSKRTQGVIADIGNFGGLFEIKGYAEPVLVSSTDGVGTKLRMAFLTGKHDTMGLDLVNHCVNDILVQGAKPLFFMDYIATSEIDPAVIERIVEGFVEGCYQNNCTLLGGETAELPGFYQKGHYDLAGFVVGAVEKSKIIDGSTIEAGDKVIGLESSGLHTNGYSLALKLLLEMEKMRLDEKVGNKRLKEVLMAPHKSYLKSISALMEKFDVKGLAHITGGGLLENVPRILPRGVSVKIRKDSWDVQPIFRLMQEKGHIAEQEMYRTFNMGIGMVVIAGADEYETMVDSLAEHDERPYLIGEVVEGEQKIILE
ncbi:phosphoribosylformylglycinamidine cyclo-ligase [Candidatus Woesearchaeota archaeon]|nr:phosphoribosylformylglycinamidine cyclo-ligase [Candidatus Woesearchaeota archaeon]